MKKLKDDTKTNTEKLKINQKLIMQVMICPVITMKNVMYCQDHIMATEYTSISDNKLRPANSLMCNGISHKTTDSCYYY